MESKHTFQNPLNAPILLSDFEARYVKKYGDNCPPYTRAVLDDNNTRVRDFISEVLVPRAKDGKVNANDAGKMFDLWITGKWIREEMKHLEHINIPTREQVDYWLKIFSQDIKDIAKLGVYTISSGFNLLVFYHDYCMTKQKYEHIFTTDNFEDWRKNASTNFKYLGREIQPFDLKDISDKAMTVLQFKIITT